MAHALAGVDLNLLIALHALLEEENVTKAARRVGLSQSAMSHALGRLRAHFDDPLLVRNGRAMEATATARQLLDPTRTAVRSFEQVFRRGGDLLSEQTMTLRITTDDYVGTTALPGAVHRLGEVAPGIDVTLIPRGAPGRKRMLRDGSADLAIGYFSGAGMDLCRHPLWTDEWRTVGRRGSMRACQKDVEAWARRRHIVVSPTGGNRGAADRALEEAGLTRHVGLVVPYFVVAMRIAAQTDAIVTVPARLARGLANALDLDSIEPPLQLPRFEVVGLWHPRLSKDPVHTQIRDVVFAAMACGSNRGGCQATRQT